MGRAGVPQKTIPFPRMILLLGTPLCAPRMAPDWTRTWSAMPTWPPMMTSFSITERPEPPVVADMHKVIDFRPAADTGQVEGAAIDGGVGADLDVVFENQAAELGELFVTARLGIAHVTETVAAQHGAGMHHHAVAQFGGGINRHVGIEAAVLANGHVGTDHAAGAYTCSFADCHLLADHGMLFDADPVGQPGVGMHDGAGMDCGGLRLAALQPGSDAREGESRVGRDEQRLGVAALGGELSRNHGGGV